jgi:hypothetical protein
MKSITRLVTAVVAVMFATAALWLIPARLKVGSVFENSLTRESGTRGPT